MPYIIVLLLSPFIVAPILSLVLSTIIIVNKRLKRSKFYREAQRLNSVGIYKEAIDCFTKVIGMYRICPDAYNNRGCVFLELKDYKNAISDFSIALHQDKKYAKSYYNRALAFYWSGDYSSSTRDFNEYMKLTKKSSETELIMELLSKISMKAI